MTEKLYYWAENLEGYSSDNEQDYDQIIEIKRLNFFIGKNNAGKSRFLRNLFTTEIKFEDINYISLQEELTTLHDVVNDTFPRSVGFQNQYGGNLREELLRLINEILNCTYTSSPLRFKKLINGNLPEIQKFYDNNDKEKFNAILKNYHQNSFAFYKNYANLNF